MTVEPSLDLIRVTSQEYFNGFVQERRNSSALAEMSEVSNDFRQHWSCDHDAMTLKHNYIPTQRTSNA